MTEAQLRSLLSSLHSQLDESGITHTWVEPGEGNTYLLCEMGSILASGLPKSVADLLSSTLNGLPSLLSAVQQYLDVRQLLGQLQQRVGYLEDLAKQRDAQFNRLKERLGQLS